MIVSNSPAGQATASSDYSSQNRNSVKSDHSQTLTYSERNTMLTHKSSKNKNDNMMEDHYN